MPNSTDNNSSSQFVCIKRPEPGLSNVFEEMYMNERLVDVTLSCADGQLQAHKLVLAASSPYFSNLFNKLPNPFHYPVIIIKDMTFEDLKLIVDFIYKGQLTITQERLNRLAKGAENLQIIGLSSSNSLPFNSSNDNNKLANGITDSGQKSSTTMQKFKRVRKQTTSNHQQQIIFPRPYQSQNTTDKLLEQSMMVGEAQDGAHHQFYGSSGSDSTPTINLTNQLHTPDIHLAHNHHHAHSHHHLTSANPQHNLANQFMGQVLSHSLVANKSSMIQGNTNTSNIDMASNQVRGRVHLCNICCKTFREKANLKRHLQVHSEHRVPYICPECNKTFAWKDNYIRHTKTAHHINNLRPQTQ